MARKPRKFARSSGSGEFVSAATAKAKPAETTIERDDSPRLKAIEARLTKLEAMIVLGEAHARNAYPVID